MQKEKVLIFTDCYIYGGSERLMSFLINNEILNREFNLQFSFRHSSIYKKGMANDFEGVSKGKINALPLLSNETLFYQINCLSIPRFLKIALKIPFFILEKIQIYSLVNLLVFTVFLKRTGPTVIHINNGGYPGAKSCNLLVLANSLTLRSKVVYQVNNQATPPKKFGFSVDPFIGRNVDLFLTASHLAKQKLVDIRKFDPKKIEVINNCVISEHISLSRRSICEQLQLSQDTFILSQVAFLTRRKGQAHLLRSLALLFENHLPLKEKITVIFIGDGENEQELKTLAKHLKLEKNAKFLGYKQNSHDYIAASDVFVLPSISDEDMPLVILTALQMGKPIISSNFAGIAQAIQHEQNGILIDLDFEKFDHHLADAIYELYSNETFKNKLGDSARASFAKYTPEKYGENLTRIYNRLNDRS